MENKKLGALFLCSLAWLALLSGCSKQEELNQSWDRLDFEEREWNFIHGSGWSRQWPRDDLWPRRWMWSGGIFSWTQQKEMMWNPNWTEKLQEASLPTNGKLAVLNNCIWCGKCARIASANFEMKWWISVVKSQENINSQSVNHAMQECPVDAIVIES